MSRKHTKNATSVATAEKAQAPDQINGEEIQDVVEASGATMRHVHGVSSANSGKATAATTPEPVADPADKLSADIAEHVSYWAANIQGITLPRRLFSSRRLFRDEKEIKGFKADLKLVYAFLLMLHDTAKVYADKKGQKDVAFTLAVPVGVIRDAFGLTEATTQRYLAMLGDGEEGKKTGATFFHLVNWKKDRKGFHIVKIYDLRYKDVAGFELK